MSDKFIKDNSEARLNRFIDAMKTGKSVETTLQRQQRLRSPKTALRNLKANKPQCEMTQFVIDYGKEYQSYAVEEAYDYFKNEDRFRTCMEMVMCAATQSQPLTYVEGYATTGAHDSLFLHAWCVETGSIEVIDPTRNDVADYYGIAFDYAFIKRVLRDTRNDPQHPPSILLAMNANRYTPSEVYGGMADVK